MTKSFKLAVELIHLLNVMYYANEFAEFMIFFTKLYADKKNVSIISSLLVHM